jgi:hypothetical protein
MWIWRKMLRISWMETSNEWVCLAIGIKKKETLQQIELRTKLRFIGHVMRSDGKGNDAVL